MHGDQYEDYVRLGDNIFVIYIYFDMHKSLVWTQHFPLDEVHGSLAEQHIRSVLCLKGPL